MIRDSITGKKLSIFGGEKEFKESIIISRPTPPPFQDIEEPLKEVLGNKWLTNGGKFLKSYEEKLSGYIGSKCIATSNGTVALLILAKALGLKGEVIVPSFTFPATATSFNFLNIKTKFVDIDKETYCIDPNEVKRAINEDTSAIVPVNIYGNCCDIKKLENIAENNDLKLIFDSAHAFGAKYNGEMVGNFGDAEMFSTHATKILITGEGGIISSKNNELLDKIRIQQNFGYDDLKDKSQIQTVGINAKMSEFPAIIGLWSLDNFENHKNRRNEIAKIYLNRLSKIKGIGFQKTTPGCERVYQFFSILIDKDKFGVDRDQLAEVLMKENVLTRKYFYLPVHQQHPYKTVEHDKLKITDEISSNILCLPILSDMTNDQAERICALIKLIHEQAEEINNYFRKTS